MPIRIYAFAKELGLDNKSLLDICEKVGINGKGSALASLSDEEVIKVKKQMESGGESKAPPAAPASGTATIERPERSASPLDRMRSNDRPRVLDRPRRQDSPARPLSAGKSGGDRENQRNATGDDARGPLAKSSPSGEGSSDPSSPRSRDSISATSGSATAGSATAGRTETGRTETGREAGPNSSSGGNSAGSASGGGSAAASERGPLSNRSPLASRTSLADRTPTTDRSALTDRSPSQIAARRDAGNGDGGASGGDSNRGDGGGPSLEPRRKGPLLSRTGPIRNLDPRAKRSAADDANKSDRDAKRDRGPKSPVARLAAMPQVKQPSPEARRTEERVVKPDLALPQDAIQKVKRHGGAALPLSAFTESAKKGKKGKDPVTGRDVPVMPTEEGSDRRRRGGGKGKVEKGDANVDSGMSTIRQKREKRTDRRVTTGGRFRDEDSPLRFRRRRPKSGSVNNTAAPRKDKAVLQLPCTVRTFSEVAGVSAGQVLKALMVDLGMGMTVNINSMLNEEMVELLVSQLEVEIEIRSEESLEDNVLNQFEIEDDPSTLVARPPIVTFLGHVDHGKTSLLDAIIGINVVSGEAGGITQSIRAYTVDKDGRQVAFVDTPGHEAFTEMRARGANVTDIAVLVVAADDGIMPQTEEAISHAKAAGVPIIVAMNKIDLPGANPDKVLQQLAAHELMPSQWGGEVEVVQTSAIDGTGMDELLETILTTAELYEFKANPARAAMGTCLEAQQDPDRGVIAKVMVQNGTLRVGDIVLCGTSYGRVKAMMDTLKPGVRHETAGPSIPVNITGLDSVPGAGEKLFVVQDIAEAREIAASRDFQSRDQALSGITKRVSLVEFQQRLEAGDLAGSDKEVVTLNLVLRADARGSIEAIQKELGKLEHPEVRIRLLQSLVGGITVGDVRLAQASNAVIIGFNVVPDETARSLAEDLQVEVRRYEVIYKVADDIKATLEGKLKPEKQAVELGALMVLRTFNVSRMGTIAGCRVMRGTVQRGSRLRVIRDNRVLGDYGMESLKREKDDAKEVTKGMECGVKLEGFNDVKEGDMLEAYRIEEVARTL